jgi:hypothetical protein
MVFWFRDRVPDAAAEDVAGPRPPVARVTPKLSNASALLPSPGLFCVISCPPALVSPPPGAVQHADRASVEDAPDGFEGGASIWGSDDARLMTGGGLLARPELSL